MTPTSCTGARWLAAAEKNVPDPPRTLSARAERRLDRVERDRADDENCHVSW